MFWTHREWSLPVFESLSPKQRKFWFCLAGGRRSIDILQTSICLNRSFPFSKVSVAVGYQLISSKLTRAPTKLELKLELKMSLLKYRTNVKNHLFDSRQTGKIFWLCQPKEASKGQSPVRTEHSSTEGEDNMWGCASTLALWLPASVVVSRLVQWDLLIQLCFVPCYWMQIYGACYIQYSSPSGRILLPHFSFYSPRCIVKITWI